MREVFEHLAEEGRLFDAAGSWRDDLQVGPGDVPQGVRLVVGRRLERLSSDCRKVLSLAAVLGRTLDYQLLQAVSDMGDEALLVALEEAEGAGLLVSNGRGTLAFSHELIRQALLALLTALRRQRLHLLAAQAIETIHGDLLQSHAGEIASHYRLAGVIADPEKAVFYAEKAAEASRTVYAWEEASSHYQWALQSFELAGFVDNHRRCDLLLALGEVLVAGGDRSRAREVAPQALAVADGIGDHSRAFAACRLGFDAEGGPSPQYWLEQAERYVGENIKARIELNGYKSVRAVHDGRFQETRALLLEALGLARGMDDPGPGLDIAGRLMRYGSLSADEERQLFDETRALDRGSSRTRARASMSLDAVMTHLQWGEREEAELERQELVRLATETRHQTAVRHATAADALFATLDGRPGEALHLIADAGVGSFPRLWRARLANWLADSATLQAELDWARTFDSYLRTAYEAYFLAQAGRTNDAREVLSSMAGLSSRAREHVMNNAIASILLEAAVLSSDRKAASVLLDFFNGDHRQLATPNFVFVPRHLGGAATLLGDFERAKATYYKAIAFCEGIGFRPELALTRLELAELLLKHFPNQRAIALAHLNLAMPELEAMGMEPAFQRASRLGGRKRRSRESNSATYPDSLSEREVEVLRLITAGKSNGQIASELVISLNTVTHHVSSIFNKTQSANRTEAAAYAHRLGLV